MQSVTIEIPENFFRSDDAAGNVRAAILRVERRMTRHATYAFTDAAVRRDTDHNVVVGMLCQMCDRHRFILTLNGIVVSHPDDVKRHPFATPRGLR